MDASYKIQRGIHVHLIQFFMCPEFWVHITPIRSVNCLTNAPLKSRELLYLCKKLAVSYALRMISW